jgi:hypothetical protein
MEFMNAVFVLMAAATIIGLVFVLPIASVYDAMRLPSGAWVRAGMSRRKWVGLMALGPIFVVPFASLAGIITAALYWTRRGALRATGG